MYDEKRELIATYRALPVTLSGLVRQVDDAPTSSSSNDTDWSIGEIVCHLLDSEQRTYERVLRIRDEDRPALPLFLDDEYRGRRLNRTLAILSSLRLEHARLLEELESAAWSRTGIHEVEGELSILDIARHTTAHDAEHVAQIGRLVQRH